MASPIGSVDGSAGAGRVRRRRKGDSAQASGAAEEVHETAGVGPIPPLDPAPQPGSPALSAQLMGQSDSAEGADPANSAARRAHGAYLKVEWSGPQDRRTRRGRIAKTEA